LRIAASSARTPIDLLSVCRSGEFPTSGFERDQQRWPALLGLVFPLRPAATFSPCAAFATGFSDRPWN
jgi:hypothetical protein